MPIACASRVDSWTTGQPDEGFAFLMNMRKPQFADRNVRKALALATPFETASKTVYSALKIGSWGT
jgi:ABC-type oligopeptide transport system substrate-binding subunit